MRISFATWPRLPNHRWSESYARNEANTTMFLR